MSPQLKSYLSLIVVEMGVYNVKEYSLLLTCHVLGVLSRYSVCDLGWAAM